jgi:hypothetical protein
MYCPIAAKNPLVLARTPTFKVSVEAGAVVLAQPLKISPLTRITVITTKIIFFIIACTPL